MASRRLDEHRAPRRLSQSPGLPLILLAACFLVVACTSEQGPFDNLLPGNYQVQNPSRTAASATGTACGFVKKQALIDAEQTASYNLRSVTGPAKYKIRYRLVRVFKDDGRVCAEVEATAST